MNVSKPSYAGVSVHNDRFSGRKKIEEDSSYLSIITGSSVKKISLSQIEVIEQEGRVLHIEASGEGYDCYDRIENVAGVLVGRAFYRPMKRLIINFDKVSEISDGMIELESGVVVSMGRNNYIKTKQAFKRYLLRYPPFGCWEPTSMLAEQGLIDHKK